MPDQSLLLSPAVCDNEVVAALVLNRRHEYLVFDRVKEPPGAAFIAGHRDKHGNWEKALCNETNEETGLTVVSKRPVIVAWTDNRCGRVPGPLGAGHTWLVFEVTATGEVTPDPREARNTRWESRAGIAALARRTIDYAQGRITEAEWDGPEGPGLEPIWVWLLSMCGVGGWQLLHVSEADRSAVLKLSQGNRPVVPV